MVRALAPRIWENRVTFDANGPSILFHLVLKGIHPLLEIVDLELQVVYVHFGVLLNRWVDPLGEATVPVISIGL
jgi:hypothetical protein